MNVFINHTSYEVSEQATLHAALEKAGVLAQRGIAVAVNNAVITRSDWNNHCLHDNDKVTVIRATQGG